MIGKILSTLLSLIGFSPAMFALSGQLPGSCDGSNASIDDKDYERAGSYLDEAERYSAENNREAACASLQQAWAYLIQLDTFTNDFTSLQNRYYRIKSQLR